MAYNRSTFPDTIDQIPYKYTLPASLLASAQQYQDLIVKPNLSSSDQIILTGLQTQLAPYLSDVETWNKFVDCILGMENFITNEVVGFIDTKQNQFNATLQKFSSKGSFSTITTYQQWNTVSFGNQTYMSLQDSNLNHTPTGTTDLWWQLMAVQGATGLTGANGLGLSYVGNYSIGTAYYIGNAVNYSNNIYYCINSCTGVTPTNASYWTLFLSNAGIVIQTTVPTSPYTNLVWVDSSTSQNIMKYWNGTVWVVFGNTASNITIADAGNIISATTVEGALQEIAGNVNTNTTNIVTNTSNITTNTTNLSAHLSDSTYQLATGTATAITLTSVTLTNLYPKTFIASANNNASATTINTKPLYKPNTTTAPTLISGKAYTIWYSTTGSCFFIKASAEGTATQAQVLAGVPFSNENDTGLVGTMANNGSPTATITTQGGTVNVPVGYSPSGTVTANITNLIASNIVNTATVGGITGTARPLVLSAGALVLDNTGYGVPLTSSATLYGRTYTVNFSGTVRLGMSLYAFNVATIGYCQVYKNGVAIGILESVVGNAGTVVFTQDLACSYGDVFTFKAYYSGNSSSNFTGCSIGIANPTTIA